MIALNHSFVGAVAHGNPDSILQALRLLDHVRRRTRGFPLVHNTIATFDTGRGPLVAWANQARGGAQQRPLAELLLRALSGPFVSGDRFEGDVAPPIAELPVWLEDVVRTLLGGETTPERLLGMVSPAPTGGADAVRYAGTDREASNWLGVQLFDDELTAVSAGRSTLDVLLAAEQEMGGQLVVLPSARRSAEAWMLDCPASDLHRALLGLEVYVAALREGLSRERCADRYHERTTVPMSQESGATWRVPTRRQQRMFIADHHGTQYFDMHAKPGTLTRVHIWVPPFDVGAAVTPIYLGHCGRHLD